MRRSVLQIARGAGNAWRWRGITGTLAHDSLHAQHEAKCCSHQHYTADAGSFLAIKPKISTHGVRQGFECRHTDVQAARWTRAPFSTRSGEEELEDILLDDREPTADTAGTSYDKVASQSQKADIFSLVDGRTGAPPGGMGKKEWRQWINQRLAETKSENGEDLEGGGEEVLPEGQRDGEVRTSSTHAKAAAAELSTTWQKDASESLQSLKDLMASLEVQKASEGALASGHSSVDDAVDGTGSLDDDFGFVKDFTELDEEDGFLSGLSADEQTTSDDEELEDDWVSEMEEDMNEIAELSPEEYDLDDESSSYHFRPGRPFFPGQTYNPEELDLSVRNDQLSYTERRGDRVYNKKQMLRFTDFRNVRFLSGYITDTANIVRKSKTKTSSKAQRKLVREIKTARILGLLPFTNMGRPPFRIRRLMYEPDTSTDEDLG